MRSIFAKRTAFKPFEYPDVCAYKDAINQSYWLVTEWNFISDIHDFHTKLDDVERSAVTNTMLAISQIEVSVKRFWGKLGDHFPKAEIEQVGITFGECHADGTEILTPRGWRDLADVRVGDDVLQFHDDDNTFSITKVLHKTDQPYCGKMYRFAKASTETVVTPNHRMLCYEQGKPVVTTAEDLVVTNSHLFLPEAGKLSGGSRHALSFMDRLRVALQSDGTRRFYDSGHGRKPRKGIGHGAEYDIGISKKRKIERLEWILANVQGVSFSRRTAPSRPGMTYYTIRIDGEHDYKTLDWVDLYDKSSDWCEDFVQELAQWDGHRVEAGKDCLKRFSSTVKSAADVAQMVGVAAGYRTNLMTHVDRRGFQDTHVVSFTSNRERVTLPPLRKQAIPYSGTVRCVTVESGTIITRYNGKTFIAKNSEVRHADAYSHLLEVLGLNDDFALLLENPVIQGRVDYLTKYLRGAAGNSSQNYTLSLTLFSIFIENVSLFSQFLVIQSFWKAKALLKDIDNVVQATRKEETVHALFGVCLLGHIKSEHPDWFDDDFYAKIGRACKKAYEAEAKIIDWIFEAGELSFLSVATVKEFIKARFNESLELIGAKPMFETDPALLASVAWFDVESTAEVSTDFFHKKPVTYSKKTQPIKAEDLF